MFKVDTDTVKIIMSHEHLRESSEISLNSILESMAYQDKLTTDLTSIKKWLEARKFLSSLVNGERIGDDSSGQVIRMEALSQQIGTDVEARLLNEELDEIFAYNIMQAVDGDMDKLSRDEQLARQLKFEDLVKNKAKDLAHLEAYAGNVPAWTVHKYDVPRWLQSCSSEVTTEIRKQLEVGNAHILLPLTDESYSLNTILAVFSAFAQVDGPIRIFMAPYSNPQLLLPVCYLIDALNSSRIRKATIDVLLMTSELLSGLVIKLEPMDDAIKDIRPKGVMEIGNGKLNQLMESNVSTASVNLAISNGQSVHYVIHSTADIASAVSSISRNVWSCGTEINRRSRSLAFIHEPVYSQVVDGLKETVEKMKVSDPFTNCDFVSKKVNSASAALSSVGKLGAKIIATKQDYSVPTVVYDIGTSSDLIAVKESGLGHILVLIPYRSLDELFSLGNNFGVPCQCFLYSNCYNTSMTIIRKLNAAEMLVNSATPPPHCSLVELSWQVVPKLKNTEETTIYQGYSSINVPAVNVDASKWREQSISTKIESLSQIIEAVKVDSTIFPTLLSNYIESTLWIPRRNDVGISGIVFVNAAGTPTSEIITALIACVLRDKPVVIVSLGTGFPSNIENIIKLRLPTGLVGFTIAKTVEDIGPLASNWELTWVFQGADKTIKLDDFPSSSENQLLLVNKPNDTATAFNAKIAIISAYKKCHM